MAKEIAVKEGKKISKTKDTRRKNGKVRFVFFKEVGFELKKVTWPTKKDMVSYSLAVIVFILIFAAFVGGIDWLLANGLNLVIE